MVDLDGDQRRYLAMLAARELSNCLDRMQKEDERRHGGSTWYWLAQKENAETLVSALDCLLNGHTTAADWHFSKDGTARLKEINENR